MEAIPEGNLYGQKVGLAVVFAFSLFLITAFIRNPYDMQPMNSVDFTQSNFPWPDSPTVNDVNNQLPLWETDPGAFIDPPSDNNPDWLRVGFLYPPDPTA